MSNHFRGEFFVSTAAMFVPAENAEASEARAILKAWDAAGMLPGTGNCR